MSTNSSNHNGSREGQVADPATATPAPIHLPTTFAVDAFPTLQRTLSYAADPETYLRSTLGDKVFEARRHLMSLPKIPSADLASSAKATSTGNPGQDRGQIDGDIYGMGEHRANFEAHIARLLGKPYATFFGTGILAQGVALKVWSLRKGRSIVAWHGSTHLEIAEKKAFEHLWGLHRDFIAPERPETLPGISDIQIVLDKPLSERPAAILLELPARELGCVAYSWDKLVEISKACHDADVALHLDGARIWEIEPWYNETYGKTFADIISLFDSAYVSFYKGLCGTAGSMLAVSDEEFLKEAKVWRTRAGGTPFTSVFNVTENERAFNEHIGTFAEKWHIIERVVAGIAAETQSLTKNDQPIISFNPNPPICSQCHIRFSGYSREQIIAALKKVQTEHGIFVFHGPRSWAVLQKILRGEVEIGYDTPMPAVSPDEREFFTEFNIGSTNSHVPEEMFVKGFVLLVKELVAMNDEP